jgi:histidine ammonia-lyase
MLSAGITPVVHEYGSLGCSGDLAPLAHCALAAMGEGEVRDASEALRPAAEALAAAGIEPVQLAEKEGLALINGTDGMLGMLVLACHDLRTVLRTADVAAAMSVEALLGTDAVFAADLQALRPHPGQADSAANLRTLLSGSGIMASHRTPDCTRVQDAYSLRCAPQVHGAARDTLAHAETVAGRELAAAVDNPVVTMDGRVESNGNFHGAPVAYVLDFLAIAAADVASMSERRTDRFLDVARNHGLPPFLADDAGVDSGHMIAQYTQAGIVSELKRLAAPPRRSTRSRPARCRRTTSRWGGPPRASCGARSTGSPGWWRSSCSPRRGPSICGRRSRPPPPRPPCATGCAPTCPARVPTGGWLRRSRPPWSSSPPVGRSPPPSAWPAH